MFCLCSQAQRHFLQELVASYPLEFRQKTEICMNSSSVPWFTCHKLHFIKELMVKKNNNNNKKEQPSDINLLHLPKSYPVANTYVSNLVSHYKVGCLFVCFKVFPTTLPS